MDGKAFWGAMYLGYSIVIGIPAVIYIIFVHWRAGTLSKAGSSPKTEGADTTVMLLCLGMLLIFAENELNLNHTLSMLLLVVYVCAVLGRARLKVRQ